MVGNFCNRTACRIRNRRRRHDHNMTLRKKRTPRASQHYLGWRAGQKSLLLPVAGESFLLTLPFIERGYRTSEIGLILNVWSRGVARWFRWSLSVADSFVCRCLTNSAMLPFPHAAHRTGRAGLPHPALGEDSRNRCSHCL